MISRRAFLAVSVMLMPAVPARADASERPSLLIAAARSQVGRTTSYDPAYVRLSYPGGDVPFERGVCTDVVIRAYRDAFDVDLQKLVHEDMRQNFAAYPKSWGLKRPDTNIDHRRVPNLQRFFGRKGAKLAVSLIWPGYEPGDIVTCKLPGNLDHIGIVSDQIDPETRLPHVIHNIGRGTQEDDAMWQHQFTGRYRFAL